MNPNELDALIEDCLENQLTESDAARLSAQLQTSAQARRRYWESASIHGLLEHTMQQASVRILTGEASSRVTHGFYWRPLAVAASLGIALGIFCTSFVLAYIAPATNETSSLLNEGFEEGARRWTSGFPNHTGEWGGDHGEVVSGNGEVQPLDGLHMARLDPSPASTLSYLERVLDLQSLPVPQGSELRQIAVTASFHATERGLRHRYTLRVAAFAEAPENVRELWVNRQWRDMDDALATSKRAISTALDAEGWQTLTAIVEIPRDSKSLIISLGSGLSENPDYKSAHYIDGVHAKLSIGSQPVNPKVKRIQLTSKQVLR
jgi:hypothetical protein